MRALKSQDTAPTVLSHRLLYSAAINVGKSFWKEFIFIVIIIYF